MARDERQVVISVEHVSKNFMLPHQRPNSVKSVLTGFYGKKTVEPQHALKDINFDIREGEFFGIVGRNGSGKSTLLKILANIYRPTEGKVSVHGKLIPFIELGVGFNTDLTGRENVYLNGAMLGFSEAEVDAMYDDIVSFAELERFMDQKLKNYSSGMQVRLAFSVATRAKADVLLIDEVLAVGDADFQRKCYEYFKSLKKNKTTVVFVSHDMNAVREFCDRAVLIDQSKLTFAGTPEEVAREYALLFMDNDAANEDTNKQRWGTGAVRFTDIKAELVGDKIKVRATAEVKQGPIDGLLYGIHVVGSDGVDILATNNRLINAADVKKVEQGDRIDFSWEMLNIFNDGKYTLTLTIVDDTQAVLDWCTNAASFRVKRAERSVTAVIPPMSVTHQIAKKQS